MKNIRKHSSENYNWIFDIRDGFFVRWGKTINDDPNFSPVGPEILDIEISTICSQGCPHCYKSNTKNGKNMSFKTFKKMFKKFPTNLTQIAFGIGDIDGNPDLWKIMKYCRKNGVIPNITINGERFRDTYATKLAMVCGAVAVSHYNDDTCFNAVEMLLNSGLKQVNIHKLLSNETFYSTIDLFDSIKLDPRLKGLNAVVLLGLKQKGRGEIFTPLPYDMFEEIVNYGMRKNIPLGFDSCSAHKFLKAVADRKDFEHLKTLVEPCESTCFSYYINVRGEGYPCSFLEGICTPVNVLGCKDFIPDVWNHLYTKIFRKGLIDNGRQCPHYKI